MEKISKKIVEAPHVRGTLALYSGNAYDLEYKDGLLINYKFERTGVIFVGSNTVCNSGLQFANSRGWDCSCCIAIGNGATTGPDSPSTTNIKLKNEITGRLNVDGDANSRCKDNKILLGSLWQKGGGYIGEITEWGLFLGEKGSTVQGRETGKLFSRKAYNWTRNDNTRDVQLFWMIEYTNI